MDLTIILQSFGYKIGIPQDADFIFDVRCLPNPYWDISLRDSSGLAPEVKNYLQQQTLANELIADIQKFLQTWLPRFANDRNHIKIAIGCTGGQHRSVYVAQELMNRLKKDYPAIKIEHLHLQ